MNENKKKKKYYITTPIYYVNDKPHIGHAYTSLACDVIARFKRLDGYNVMFLTGTDEHGQKVQSAAYKAKISPKEFTDVVSKNFEDLTKIMNFTNDKFIRTTDESHSKNVQKLWKKLYKNGHITLGKYSGWYSIRDESFYSEDELVQGKAPTGAPVEWVEEESYFFNLSRWEKKLLKLYEDNPNFISPKSRMNEIKSFVSSGLHDLSISRTTFNWGVKVPDDNNHVVYVWLDALANYISAIGWENNHENYEMFWPADLHMVGKDILRFHTVYWPAFLMAAELPIPKKVFAHGWWTNEGEKISKSLGNIIDPIDLIEKYGLDQTRFFLIREVPFGRDGDFSNRSMISRINSDLANDLGNLCQRTLSFVYKNLDKDSFSFPKNLKTIDKEILEKTDCLLEKVRKKIDNQELHNALNVIWNLIAEANRYIDKEAPWLLKKTDPERMQDVLIILMEVIRNIGILTQAFIPDSSNLILNQLNINNNERNFKFIDGMNRISISKKIEKPIPIFPKYIENLSQDE